MLESSSVAELFSAFFNTEESHPLILFVKRVTIEAL